MSRKCVVPVQPTRVAKARTPAQREQQRARRWMRTGVSAATVAWMKRNGML